ncbi:MAG: hypothetical protein ACXW25_00055 [Rhodospirillales bacterium]
MTNEIRLLGEDPAQGSLFGAEEDRLQPPQQDPSPDPAMVRDRLNTLLEKARSSETMPWSDRDARMWQTVFPNMAKWLPEDEAMQLCLDFFEEIGRLKNAA